MEAAYQPRGREERTNRRARGYDQTLLRARTLLWMDAHACGKTGRSFPNMKHLLAVAHLSADCSCKEHDTF